MLRSRVSATLPQRKSCRKSSNAATVAIGIEKLLVKTLGCGYGCIQEHEIDMFVYAEQVRPLGFGPMVKKTKTPTRD